MANAEQNNWRLSFVVLEHSSFHITSQFFVDDGGMYSSDFGSISTIPLFLDFYILWHAFVNINRLDLTPIYGT